LLADAKVLGVGVSVLVAVGVEVGVSVAVEVGVLVLVEVGDAVKVGSRVTVSVFVGCVVLVAVKTATAVFCSKELQATNSKFNIKNITIFRFIMLSPENWLAMISRQSFISYDLVTPYHFKGFDFKPHNKGVTCPVIATRAHDSKDFWPSHHAGGSAATAGSALTRGCDPFDRNPVSRG